MLESAIQRAVVEYAKKQGVVGIKLTALGPLGATGWPDFLFLGPDMQVRWVEFKQAKGKLTPLQRRRHEQLAALGWDPLVVPTIEQGKQVIDSMLRHRDKAVRDARQTEMWKR